MCELLRGAGLCGPARQLAVADPPAVSAHTRPGYPPRPRPPAPYNCACVARPPALMRAARRPRQPSRTTRSMCGSAHASSVVPVEQAAGVRAQARSSCPSARVRLPVACADCVQCMECMRGCLRVRGPAVALSEGHRPNGAPAASPSPALPPPALPSPGSTTPVSRSTRAFGGGSCLATAVAALSCSALSSGPPSPGSRQSKQSHVTMRTRSLGFGMVPAEGWV